jgi:hypothetical protein
LQRAAKITERYAYQVLNDLQQAGSVLQPSLTL